jgi:site-specific recombinase XerD
MGNGTALQEFERYLRRRYPERSTAKHYLSDLRQFEKVCTQPWGEVTPQDIEAFVDYGQQQGWKPATLTRRVAALKTFFEFWAVETNTLERPNPVQPWRHAPKRGQRLPRDLADEVVEQLWLAIDQPRDQLWFTLMLRGGLRVGEVVALNRGDVLAPATASQPARLRVLGKGRKERVIYLSADAYAVVARWMLLMPGGPDTPLCPNARGKRLTVNGLQDRLQHFAAKAGVHVTCHQLRHTFARQLVEHDLPVTTLSKLLGHECLSTTQVYLTGADPQVRQDYAAAMAQWDEPRPLPPRPAGEAPAPPPVPPPVPPADPAPLAPAPLPDLADTWAPTLPAWVREACLVFVHQQARNWKSSQQRRHSKRRLDELAQFWTWQLARRPIQAWAEVTRADLQAFINERFAAGRAPSTVKNILYPLWGALRLRQTQGDPIPESVFRLELPKGRDVAPRHLSEAEAAGLERHMRAYLVHDTPETRRDAAWYFVLAHTGIRLNELIDLCRGDLDLAGGRLRIDQGKGRKDRVVYLSDTAQQALDQYLAAWPPQALDAPLFYRTAHEPLGYRWVEARLRQLGDEAGVAHVTPHRLRHTLATRLINRGMPVTTLQKLLGHADLNTTQRYARVADQTVERDYRQVMARIEQETTGLSLAPIPLDVLLSGGAARRERVTQPLDNSM